MTSFDDIIKKEPSTIDAVETKKTGLSFNDIVSDTKTDVAQPTPPSPDYLGITQADYASGISKTSGSFGDTLIKSVGLAEKMYGIAGEYVNYGFGNIAGVAGSAVGALGFEGAEETLKGKERAFDEVGQEFRRRTDYGAKVISDFGTKVSSVNMKMGELLKEDILEDDEAYKRYKKKQASGYYDKLSIDKIDEDLMAYGLYGGLVENAPTMALSMFGAKGVAEYAGGAFLKTVGTTVLTGLNLSLDASNESAQKYNELAGTVPEEQALEEAGRVYSRNFIGGFVFEFIQTALLERVFGKAGGGVAKSIFSMIASGVIEAGQERAQDEIQAQSGSEEFDYGKLTEKLLEKGVSETDFIAFTLGFGMQGAGSVSVATQEGYNKLINKHKDSKAFKEGVKLSENVAKNTAENIAEPILNNIPDDIKKDFKGKDDVETLDNISNEMPMVVKNAYESVKDNINIVKESALEAKNVLLAETQADELLSKGVLEVDAVLELSEKIGIEKAQEIVSRKQEEISKRAPVEEEIVQVAETFEEIIEKKPVEKEPVKKEPTVVKEIKEEKPVLQKALEEKDTDNISLGDTTITAKEIEDSYRNLSFSSGKGIREIKELADLRQSDFKNLEDVYNETKEPEITKEELQEQFDRYWGGYLKKEQAVIGARSRTASAMITGSANFPVARNRKAMEMLMKRNDEIVDFRKKVLGVIEKKIKGSDIIKSGDADVITKLETKISKLKESHERMKKGNVIVRKYKDDLEKTKSELIKIGIEEENFNISRADGSFLKFFLQNSNAKIKSAEKRLAIIKKTKEVTKGGDKDYKFEGGKVVFNGELMRIQVVFDEKPSEESRKELKSNAFRWSPKNNAWQRTLNNRGAYLVNKMFHKIEKKDGKKETKIKEEDIKKKEKVPETGKEVKPVTESKTTNEFLDDFKKRFNVEFDTFFVDKILSNVKDKESWGISYKNTIALVKDLSKTDTTAQHEVLHMTLANLSEIPLLEKFNREELLKAQAEKMGVEYSDKNSNEIEESMANELEKYITKNVQPKDSMILNFFARLKRMLKKFANAIVKSEGDLIKDYYDTLLFAKDVSGEVTRFESNGVIKSFIEDGVLDLSKVPSSLEGDVAKKEYVKSKLKEEAKKYKTEEEFIGSQSKYYRGIPETKDFVLKPNKQGVVFLAKDKGIAESYAYNGVVKKLYPKAKNTLDLNNESIKKKFLKKIFDNKKVLSAWGDITNHFNKAGVNIKSITQKDVDNFVEEKTKDYSRNEWREYKQDAYTAYNLNSNKPVDKNMVYDNWDEIFKESRKQGFDSLSHTTQSATGRDGIKGDELVVFDVKDIKTEEDLKKIYKEKDDIKESLKFKLKEDRHFANLKDKFNKTVTKLDKIFSEIEASKMDLITAMNLRKELEEGVDVESIEAKIDVFKKYVKKGELTKEGVELAKKSGYDVPKVKESIKAYLKARAEYQSHRRESISIKKDLAGLRKDSKELAKEKREIERKISLKKARLEQFARDVERGFKRGKKEAKKESTKRRGVIRDVKQKLAVSDTLFKRLKGSGSFLTMTDNQFKEFVRGMISAQELRTEREALSEDIKATIVFQQYSKYDNLRKALGLPTVSNMSVKQLEQYKVALQQYEIGDTFLSQRQIETLYRTDFGAVETEREMYKAIAEKTDLTVEDLKVNDLPIMKYFANGLIKSRHSKLFKLFVDETIKAEAKAVKSSIEYERNIDKLAKASRKSNAKGKKISEKIWDLIAPSEKIVAGYIEAKESEKAKYAEENKMTPENIKFGDAVISFQRDVYDYLKANYNLHSRFGEGKKIDYFPNYRKGFLETAKDEGFMKGFKEILKSQQEAEASAMILTDKTGEIVPYEKWNQNMQFRAGKITPTNNVASATMNYARMFFRKKSIDEFVPKLNTLLSLRKDLMGKTETGLELNPEVESYLKQTINEARGRHIGGGASLIPAQAGKVDTILRNLISIITVHKLGGRPNVGLSSFVGEMMALMTTMILNPKAIVRGVTRTTQIKKSKRVFEKASDLVGKSPLEELTSTETGLLSKLYDSLMIFFSIGSYQASKFNLRAVMTEEQWNKEVLSTTEVLDISKERNKFTKGALHSGSLIGGTVIGKLFGQFRAWSYDIVNTGMSSATRLTQHYNPKSEKKYSKEEVEEYTRDVLSLVAMGSIGYILSLLIPVDEEDEENKTMLFYIQREFTTHLQAFPTVFGYSTYKKEFDPISSPLISIAKDIGKLLLLFLSQEQYAQNGKGFEKGEKKYIKKFKEVVTPVALKGSLGLSEEKNLKDRLMKEAVEKGKIDAMDVASQTATEWYGKKKGDIEYKKKKIAEVKKEYNYRKEYGFEDEVLEAILEGDTNKEIVEILTELSREKGVDVIKKQLLKMKGNKNLCTNTKRKTDCVVSSPLWKDYIKKIRNEKLE